MKRAHNAVHRPEALLAESGMRHSSPVHCSCRNSAHQFRTTVIGRPASGDGALCHPFSRRTIGLQCIKRVFSDKAISISGDAFFGQYRCAKRIPFCYRQEEWRNQARAL
jgi:hypothetical protein